MSLSFRQRHRLRCMRRTLSVSAPELAAMLAMFAKLYAGDKLPAYERARRRTPAPVRALAHAAWAIARAVWAVICLCERAGVGCCRLLLRPFMGLLRSSRRPLASCGQFLRAAAVRGLIACSFLPAGFRLTAGAWLGVHRPSAPIPPTARGRIKPSASYARARAASPRARCVRAIALITFPLKRRSPMSRPIVRLRWLRVNAVSKSASASRETRPR